MTQKRFKVKLDIVDTEDWLRYNDRHIKDAIESNHALHVTHFEMEPIE